MREEVGVVESESGREIESGIWRESERVRERERESERVSIFEKQ